MDFHQWIGKLFTFVELLVNILTSHEIPNIEFYECRTENTILSIFNHLICFIWIWPFPMFNIWNSRISFMDKLIQEADSVSRIDSGFYVNVVDCDIRFASH